MQMKASQGKVKRCWLCCSISSRSQQHCQ